jgi:hypothetical protein
MGELVFRHACKLGLEGIVSKRLALPVGPFLGARRRYALPLAAKSAAPYNPDLFHRSNRSFNDEMLCKQRHERFSSGLLGRVNSGR